MVEKGYAIIDRQIKEWLNEKEVKDKRIIHNGKTLKNRLSPVITISREWGAGGTEIVKQLQEKLGSPWLIWDKQIIGEIAKRAEVRNDIVRSIEDKSFSVFESFFKGFFMREDLTQNEYRRHVTSILLALGHRGHAIIVGRGANFVLPQAFRVRLVASRKFRIQDMQKKEKVTEEEALFLIRQSDHERDEFVKQVFAGEINAPWNYDLCIKTNYIKPETVAEMIIQGAEDKLGSLK